MDRTGSMRRCDSRRSTGLEIRPPSPWPRGRPRVCPTMGSGCDRRP